jgi:hypothetical protein
MSATLPRVVLPVPPVGGVGGVRVGIAFDDGVLAPYPDWTWLTESSNLVTGYTIDRGRAFEFDKNDTGTCTVSIFDREGVLDPTNSFGPYYGRIEPLLQIIVQLLNPITGQWRTRFRGWIEDYDYGIDPTQLFTRLEVGCVDIFELLTAIEMQPSVGAPTFGHAGGPDDQIFFDNTAGSGGDRIDLVLGQAHIPGEFFVVFSLNVHLAETVYAPSQTVLEVIQDAADAEFPTVANVYVDRKGRLCVHGRMARFDPNGTAAGAGDAVWDFHHWRAGDRIAINHSLDPVYIPLAHIRQLAFNRGRSKIFNYALCTPSGMTSGLGAQVVQDAASIDRYGFRSWSAENLVVESGILTGNTAADECRAYAQYIVDNYKGARERLTLLGFRSITPEHVAAGATWDLLCDCDIGDIVEVTEGFGPWGGDGGGFDHVPFFIEGIHEQVAPLNPAMADVTLTLDVSPQAYFPPGSPLTGPH